MSTLETWKQLHKDLYFKKHPLYGDYIAQVPRKLGMVEISDKVVVEIGGGYGRETAMIAKYAKRVYLIDVCEDVLNEARSFLGERLGLKNIVYVLAEEYEHKINEQIDFVYSYLAFQHMLPEQAAEYVRVLGEKLVTGGLMVLQFRLGGEKAFPEGKEPTVRYTVDEVGEVLKGLKLISSETEEPEPGEKHLYVRIMKE